MEELISDINRVLKNSHPPKSNISKVEYRAMQQLNTDKNRIIPTAKKGMAMVVMDKQDYTEKAKNLLEQPMHSPLPADPTNKYKTKLINILKGLKKESGMDGNMYKRMYPTGNVLQSFMVFLQFIKRTPPQANSSQ